ncbi:MAG: sigma 54-interacting transcriptional regulator [Deltaproteobacteria bacterium]|jgi:hydrogenase-4 transcriptional activator|nr:sigma 54-interacting transcriptional regulator [Deltaproteobacteria bacterium]MBT6489437.1 sigma 54-interacting transcriptional regulator [Deltaproteobacteria bacterium]
MRTPSEILKYYIQAIEHLSGASAVSLYVPDPLGDGGRALLLSAGDEPIAELQSIDSATQFARTQPDANAQGPLAKLIPETIQSSTQDGLLIPLRALNQGKDEQTAWLGLRNPQTAQAPESLTGPDAMKSWWQWVLELGEAITRDIMRVSGVLNDPVSGLPGRAEFFQTVDKALETNQGPSTAMLILSPDNFATINELWGLKLGDKVIREVADVLQKQLREDDYLVRYGGVVFAILLPKTTLESAFALGSAILAELEKNEYLDSTVRLRFSGGVVATTSEEARHQNASLAFIQRANHALNAAKRAGGGRITEWKADPSTGTSTEGDELTGIFTGTMGKDYRNMVLLWETIGLMAESSDIDELSSKVLGCISNAFRPDRVGLFLPEKPDDPLALHSGFVLIKTEQGGSVQKHTTSSSLFSLEASERALLDKAHQSGKVLCSSIPGLEDSAPNLTHAALVIPLVTRENCLGCLYLDRESAKLELDVSDVHFLKVFGNHIAVAIDRGILAREEAARQERKRLRLLGEVHELRQALGHAKLVHTSPQMEQVLGIVRQVAPTDATVLVTGESGTGKGVLARTFHKLSQRADKPLVLVDCSAITPNLIESELFGHERGAFTGADRKTVGRLAEANGGTVFLDEIGELPLEVQSKLLTFVQDKQLMAVGSTKTRTVDARIIAATNRDLAVEVDAGRFRRDLYYRLNVVSVDLPPLRTRPDDILLLARHFIERFNVQYQKAARGLSAAAEHALLSYNWPGNIRELQNRVMRAVILSQVELLGPHELGFDDNAQAGTNAPPIRAGEPSIAQPAAEVAPSNPWENLSGILSSIIQQVDINSGHQPPPFGKWLEEDLIQAAFDRIGGIHRRGAAVLGIPETTFRRKMKQIKARSLIGPMPRTPEWRELNDVFNGIVRQKNTDGEDYLVRSRDILLTHVLHRFGDKVSMSAALMGVTEPTISRWRSKLQSQSAAT